ncbi:MAG TPA: HAMP domain-containing protein [Pilimelia sp.]|nr:HAMP domain-containing protein [Pilimelia sp.]
MASMVALAFLIPLALLVQQLARERALADAERQTAVVVAVLAVTTEPQAVERAISTTEVEQRLAVHNLHGARVGASHARPEDVALAALQREAVVTEVVGGLSYLEPVDIGDSIAVVEVFIPDAALNEGVETAWYALTAVAVGLVAASVLVGDRLAAKVVGSARSLARAAVALGDGNLDVRVRPSGPRELAEAGVAFNRMADRLALLRTNERELVADLSHRLRTPLTVLRLDAESLVEPDAEARGMLETGEMFLGTPEEADRRRTIRRIRQAVATLEHEIDVLIRTTRNVVTTEPTDEELCDASEVVRDRMQFWAAVAGDQNRPCNVQGAKTPAPVSLPRTELVAALDAVLGNVFRYTPQGTAFEVAVSRRDGYVAVRVDDAGAGIADPDRALRRGASDQGSTGLGLDIAKRATLAADGSVSIDRARLGGASVVMLFRDAEAAPRQASRFGLIGRLAGEPGSRRWSKPRRSVD